MFFVTEIEVSYFLQLTSFDEYFFTKRLWERKGNRKGNRKGELQMMTVMINFNKGMIMKINFVIQFC